ncbi:phytoene desaturase family protein [Demequina sp. B12]|uniref:phytoene desaturase family protein n=1 Tax=Demequina sp. B12 TaxID=2992757 RepID=UPI00237BFBEC|nr:phytoene desaturase family protein [Demequina sp. B12]MDE0572096.1 phytoene desaturase family protein [Demequina sp. B12]
MTERVVVVGGGVAGLATAALLARGGAHVTLLERHDEVGGRAGRLEVDGFTFDTGPSWYLMREAFEHFFALLGRDVSQELELVDLETRYRVFFEGHRDPLDITVDAERNWAAFDALSPGDGAAMRAYAARAGDRYRLALDKFLYTTFERPTRSLDAQTVRRLPELAGLLTQSLQGSIEKSVADPRLRQVLGFHAVFLGSAPERLPALFSLMSHLDLDEGVSYPKGGLYAVVEALARVAQDEGVEIRTGATVTRIRVDRGRATGVELADGTVVDAAAVVSGADMHHTETALLEPQFQSRPERTWRHKRPGVSALLVMAGVEGELPELAHHTLLFTRDWESNFTAIMDDLTVPDPASIYLSRTTATDPTTAPPGHENLVMLVPFPSDPSLGATARSRANLDASIGRYLTQVGEWAQIPDLPARTSIKKVLNPHYFATELNAWRGGALGLEHSLRQSAMFRPSNVSSKVSNLLYAGASTAPGIGVPICLISAELVAKRLLGATGPSPLNTPLPHGYLARSRRTDAWGALARDLAAQTETV